MATIPYDLIVSDLKKGKRSGAHQLNRCFRTLLISHAVRSAGLLREDAEEIVNDVLLTVITRIQTFRFRSSPSDFHSWIHAILHNRIKDFCRRRAVIARSAVFVGWGGEEHAVADQGEDDDGVQLVIEQALNALRPLERTVLWCRVRGVSYNEIGSYTGKPAPTLRVCFLRAQRRFDALVRQELARRNM